ncbi:MAG: GNAT family N-acetyltransferase [Leptospiraceae bacterium]|nr:GNAT family N-acetyltransferase [Leptospiraceae bacterium]
MIQIQSITPPTDFYSESDDFLALMQLADPDMSRILADVRRGECFALFSEEELVAGMVLVTEQAHIEITQIAVLPYHQNQGWGSRLLLEAEEIARHRGAKTLSVATASTSYAALHCYQKAGFRLVRIVADFFTQVYPTPLFENGLRVQDQLILQKQLREPIQ